MLCPGRNVWRIEHAARFALLIDADAYFQALREAIRHACRSIFILSWDIDSQLRLVPAGANDGYPEMLGDFLHAVVSERPDLHAYLLNWDFTMLYQMVRTLVSHFRSVPAPATFPSRWPVFALDRIWIRPRHQLLKVAVYSQAEARRASDHLPLVAKVQL